MRKLLLIIILAAYPGLARAAETATCDAKPFTLNKPKAATVQKRAATSTASVAPTKPAKPKATPKTSANQPKPKPIADCNEPARKKD